jgi:biotin synthase
MVGSPHQTVENIIEDLSFIRALNPEMIGIGPFIPHQQTPYKDARSGTLEQTLLIISILRLMLPKALIPATTALGTIDPEGRELGILAGANVVMPNLSPVEVRKDYTLYDNKICTGDEAAECRVCLSRRMESIGYEIVNNRGDHPNKKS